MKRNRSLQITTFLVVGALLGGCQGKAQGVRAWRATDHDQPEPANAAPNAADVVQREPVPNTVASASPAASSSPHGSDGSPGGAVMRFWASNCVRCHGQIGRGDGAQGQGMGVPDFTNPEWQRTATDERIAQAIGQGRGAMPAFAIERGMLVELVRLIRQMAPLAGPGSGPTQAESPTSPSRQ